MLQLDRTFFQWGKKKADVSKACYDKQALLRKLKGIEDSVKLEIKNAFLNLQDGERWAPAKMGRYLGSVG